MHLHEHHKEFEGLYSEILRYDLNEVTLNVLNIERTFVDKIMSVKRHALCGTINNKVRQIYDVSQLFFLPEIKKFLDNKDELVRLVKITKETDSFYFKKRNINLIFVPTAKYDFDSWKHLLNEDVQREYENLHKTLLYTDKKQDFDKALKVFEEIDNLLREIGE